MHATASVFCFIYLLFVCFVVGGCGFAFAFVFYMGFRNQTQDRFMWQVLVIHWALSLAPNLFLK